SGQRVVELARVEARRDADVVAEPLGEDAVHPYAELTPGRGDDASLDLVAHHAVVVRRLVRLIENADGNEKKAAFEIDAVALLVVDPGLLDLGFALVVLAHDGVLDLDFRVQRQALVETVVEPEYEARLICGGITALPKFAVRGFAVADDVRRAVGEARASVEHRAVVERIRRRRLRRR